MHCNRIVCGLSTVLIAVALVTPGRCAAPPDSSEPTGISASKSPPVPKPTLANVPYGPHERHILDFWKADSSKPTPLVFVIHGGGWQGGEKERVNRFVNVQGLLAQGIAVVAINYRFIKQANAEGIEPPVKAPLHDAARALQFVRSQAAEWNIDKARIGAAGGSAGACSSLWLAFHDDLADPKSSDPVARESTRLLCAAVIGAQTTLDPQQMKEWTPNSTYGGHAFGLNGFAQFLEGREKLLPWIAEYSPDALVTPDDPPVYLFYHTPPALGQPQKDPTHTANFGVKLQEKCQATGVACALTYPGAPNVIHATAQDYLIATLKAPGAERKPNILFIITDQQFADAMSCQMGRQFIHTPAMDRLAQTGTLFTRAYSSNPLCMPWRASVFTGRYPHETGVTQNAPPPARFDPQEFVSLGTYFRNAGYDAAYSGKWHLCFNVKDTNTHGFEMVTGQAAGGHDAGVTDGAAKFLARPHEKPFLLVASYLNPHNICEWARRLAGREQVLNCGEIGQPPPLDQLPPLPANFPPPTNEPDGMALMRRAYQVASGPFPVGKFTAEDWRKHRWGYYRMIEKVDAEIGKLLAALRQSGLEDNTLIVFTSDHGECAGAHGFNQKTVLYDESARVPLIIAFKGKTPGATTDQLVNTGIDLLPTMLEFAGLEVSKKLPGRSLVPLVLGQPLTAWRDHLVVQNNMTQTGEVDGFAPTMEGRMVRTDRYKYCLYSRGRQRESLVDMQADPGEMTNLATDPAYREALLQHRELLARFGRDHHDPLVAEMLADNVKPIAFTPQNSAAKAKPAKQARRQQQ